MASDKPGEQLHEKVTPGPSIHSPPFLHRISPVELHTAKSISQFVPENVHGCQSILIKVNLFVTN